MKHVTLRNCLTQSSPTASNLRFPALFCLLGRYQGTIAVRFLATTATLLFLLPPGLLAQTARTSPAQADTCNVHGFTHQTLSEASQFGHGLLQVPHNAVRPANLAWELPILGTTGLLIAKVDRPADNRIQLQSLQQTAGLWSNVGLGLELGSSALAWGIGCGEHRSHLRDAGYTALAAMGAAGTVDLALKLAFDRQFPWKADSTGKFWGGGRSFPSGHSATSFAFAAVIAQRYPRNRWVKWGAYALAAGVSLSRYPAKKHFPSDILMGATMGYVTGAYIAGH
jgi:membrane-associated phospholipid phosphatase